MKDHITIGKKAFIRPVVFLEGHVCTAEQAEQLNKDLVGQLRNNLASRESLTQDDVDNYAANYVFGARKTRGDPVIAEAKLIARKLIKGKKTTKELTKAVDKMLAKNSEKIMEIARRRVKELAAMSDAVLQDG